MPGRLIGEEAHAGTGVLQVGVLGDSAAQGEVVVGWLSSRINGACKAAAISPS
jgi:hypothetical protein